MEVEVVEQVLEELGLGEYIDDGTLNLERETLTRDKHKRLEKLEASRVARCPECERRPKQIRFFTPEEEYSPPPELFCDTCGSHIEVITLRMVYEGDEDFSKVA
jgi:hypothetical protein